MELICWVEGEERIRCTALKLREFLRPMSRISIISPGGVEEGEERSKAERKERNESYVKEGTIYKIERIR